jgi:hypothetical protein
MEQDGSRSILDDDVVSTLIKKANQPLEGIDHLAAAQATNQANVPEGDSVGLTGLGTIAVVGLHARASRIAAGHYGH